MLRDPYLVPGVCCDVWNDDYRKRKVMYFWGEHAGGLCFCSQYSDLRVFDFQIKYENYRPKGTEWDYAPDWAVCSTVDKTGGLCFWSMVPEHDNVIKWETNNEKCFVLNCGKCPDKTRYEGDAWKRSKRDRPRWAKVG